MKKLLERIGTIFSTVLIVVLMGAVFVVISIKASGGTPSFFGYEMKTVLSGSMEPEIGVGSVIFIKHTNKGDSFKEGDIITFTTSESILVTHRILQVENEGARFITKGDHNDGADLEPVWVQNIIGKYTGVTIPYVGYALQFATSKQGAFLLMILPGFIMIGQAIITIWGALRSLEVSNQAS